MSRRKTCGSYLLTFREKYATIKHKQKEPAMKRFIALILVLVMTVCLFSACNTEKEPDPQPEVKYGKTFYVAVDGNDSNEGTKESPLATIGGAVAKVREYKQTNGLPEGGIKVEFAAGTYKVTQQTDLTEEDSGEDGKPIVYAAADGAEVIFDGGVSLNPSDFKPANDEFKARLYSEEAKNNVLEIDLLSAGIWDFDDTFDPEHSWREDGYRQSFYVNNEMQTVARWPNTGYADSEILAPFDGSKLILAVPSDRSDLWDKETNVRFYGFPEYDWSSTFVTGLSPAPGTGGIALPLSFADNRPFYLFNIATELDTPGEYYWDVEAKKLYYWPREDFLSSKAVFTQFDDSVFCLNGVSYISFIGLTFENLRYDAINGKDVKGITVDGNVFRDIMSNPVSLSGYDNLIRDNHLYNLAGGGIYVSGGDIEEQRPSNTIVTNNLIHSYSQLYTVYNAAVSTYGCGFTVSHNEIYDAPHEAIAFNSGLTLIEYNYIHDVCDETSDAGAVYTGRRWDWGGNEIRYNYICDVIDKTHGGYPNGIYLDDSMALQYVHGNILVNIGGVGITGGGNKLQVIENNVICMAHRVALYDNDNGINWSEESCLYRGGIWENIKPFYTSDLWKYAYPGLLTAIENSEFHNYETGPFMDVSGVPVYNRYHGNVIYDCAVTIWTWRHQMDDIGGVQMGPNERANSVVTDNMKYTAEYKNDLFVDPENGNYLLKDDSRVYRDIIGFEKWDYSLIGIQN